MVKNPYAKANIITATLRFNADSIPWDKTTPVRTGRFASAFPYPSEEELKAVWEEAALTPQIIPPEMESKLNYPAGCFLLGAPFVRLGITDLRWIYLLAMLGGLAFAVVKAPAGMRWWLLGAALASLEVWQSIASGENGSDDLPPAVDGLVFLAAETVVLGYLHGLGGGHQTGRLVFSCPFT